MFVTVDITFPVSLRTFPKNKLIQFYLNNATKLHHLISQFTQYAKLLAPQHRDRVITTDYFEFVITHNECLFKWQHFVIKSTKAIFESKFANNVIVR